MLYDIDDNMALDTAWLCSRLYSNCSLWPGKGWYGSLQKFTWTVGVKFKDANDALPSAHTAEPIQRIHLGFLWLSYFYHLLPCPRSKLTTY